MKIHAGLLPWEVVLVAILALGGCDVPVEAELAGRDAAVTVRVKAALLDDANLRCSNVEVATLKGDVRLTGLLDSQTQINHVIKVVRSVNGVHSIHDELGLRKSGS